jgi:guanylate kinase
MNKKGILAVVSGFSGAGKGTVMKRLVEKYENYALSVSATTRQPRPGEVEGESYFFKSTEEFETMIKNDCLLEYAKYVNHYYGTPAEYVIQNLEAGNNVLLEIEIQGALKIKEKYKDAVLLFIMPPSAGVLKQRLAGRGTESFEVIEQRLTRAAEESEGIEQYDYIVVNDDLEECVERIHNILLTVQCEVSRNSEEIENMREQLKCFSKGE